MFLFDNGQLTCCMLCKSRRQLHWFSKWIIFQICSSRCDKSNAEEIVLEMLAYLETADYSIREEMVLKVNFKLCKHYFLYYCEYADFSFQVAIPAEKYATDYKWYV